MNGPNKMEHDLIEYIVSILENTENISDHSVPRNTSSQLHSHMQPEPSVLRAACGIRKFMDEMPGGFFIYHADGNEELIYANQAMLRIFNCDTFQEFRELTGNSFKGIVHPEDLEEVEKSIQEQILHSQHDLDYVEYRIIQKGGGIRWIEDYGHFVHSESAGDVFYVFAGDATEKRQRTLEVIEGLSINYESILYVDLDSDKILPYRLNDRINQLFERRLQSRSYRWFVPDYMETWVCPEDQNIFLQATDPSYIRKSLAEDSTYYVNYRVKIGQDIQYLQLRIANVDSEHRTSRIVMGCRRVDEEIRHEMEQKKIFEDALHHARLANIAKNTFLSNMSHDLRTPLNAIIGFTALAKSHLEDPKKALEYLKKIESSNEQLLRLLNDILEISRIESGEVQIDESEYLLDDMVQELHKSALPRASAKKISLLTDLSGVTHHRVLADRIRLEQVLRCLVNNAVKYTENGGRILIRIRELKESPNDYSLYQFSVEDNGIGIAKDAQKHIFEPFERLKNTTQSGILGTGLGLTIAKNLTEMMGGTIQVDSTPGKGSTFTITIGLRLPELKSESPVISEENAVKLLNGRKILLVEDNEINQEIETELLQSIGFQMDTAKDGLIAVRKIACSAPGDYALILMDIQMPVMDGYEATRTIRSLQNPALASIPIIALSANSFEEDQRLSRESGMNAHLPKPVNIPDLLELITATVQPDHS